MTPPTDPRRPPSEELSWEQLARYAISDDLQKQLLCRVVRELCAEREELEAALDPPSGYCQWCGQFPMDGAHAGLRRQIDSLTAQLSAYVTAAEGRPASELIAPGGVARIIDERDESRARAQLSAETAAHGMEALEAKLAEQAAEIELLRDFHEFACRKWTCFGSAPGNQPCRLNDDPDPEVFCMAHYAWDVRDEIARLKR